MKSASQRNQDSVIVPLRTTRCVSLTTFLALTLMAHSAFGQESKPGLVATYSSGNERITQVVAQPNFALTGDESIHPQIDPSFTAEWQGLLRIDRAGEYRVHADGADVLLNGVNAAKFASLATGEYPLQIRYSRKRGDARLELRWESEYFRSEPVPSAVLRHKDTPAAVTKQNVTEHGRFLFAELGCANCHAAGDWKLNSRRGPDLSNVASRVSAEWVYRWLKNPHDYRSSSVMPACLDSDQERADVTAFLMTLGTASVEKPPAKDAARVKAGQKLFEQVGCAKCHDKENNLDTVGSKYVSSNRLAEFISNPHAIDPHGRMPQLFEPSERHLAGSIAAFLFYERRADSKFDKVLEGNVERGAKLFVSSGCASCHGTASLAIDKSRVMSGPAFGQSAGLPLRHHWNFDSETSTVIEQVTGRTEKVNGQAKFAKSAADRDSAFDFDGQTYIELPHFHRPDTMTISVWVNSTHGGSIITWGRPSGVLRGSRELRMNIGQDGRNTVCYGEYNSDGGWKPVVARLKDVNLIDGKWHHVAVVREGESIRHYVDGKFKGEGKAQKGGGDYTDRLIIGALGLQSNPSNRFKGMMDDLSIWETALTPEQIAALARGETALKMAIPERTKLKAFSIDAGCLAESVKDSLPDYQLSDADRGALQRFLSTVQPTQDNSYHSAPLTLHNLRIQQFRCTKCHEYNDQNIQTGSAIDEQGRIVRLERPPKLTGAGAKLTSSWLHEVLVGKKRNRPWLNLRMPHFGARVADLPTLISSSAGVPSNDADVTPDRNLANVGLEMIGARRGEVSCISCHDYRGINRRKDGVVPAPDLADAGWTVRQKWFYRWMHDPQRIQPGTSMPQLFLDVSAEERKLRIAQLWSALYYQKELPLPKGVLDQRTEGTRIIVGDTPVVFRMATNTPAGRIDRAINVGLPGGLNFTFDAVSCQLKYAWKGDFIDAGPAWNGRGGNPVSAKGQKLLALTRGHALRIGNTDETAPTRFLGYRLEAGMPVFRYRIGDAVIEHRINITKSQLTQRYVVRGALDDIWYVGDSAIDFRSGTGTREGDGIRYGKAAIVDFEVHIPLGESSGK